MNAAHNNLKIVLAPNALKGSLTAREAVNAMATGILTVLPGAQIHPFPVADGGDGLLSILEELDVLEKTPLEVTGPLGTPVPAYWLLDRARRIAWIEMASAAGLALLSQDSYAPMQASTFGVGELIKAALDEGVQEIMLGIGGSATIDAGTGLASALGVRFLDDNGNELRPCGENLIYIKSIDRSSLDPRLVQTNLTVLCDVQNPMIGPQGAAIVYGPQKGASKAQVEALETGLQHYAGILEEVTGQNVRDLPGAGAAGGLGGGMLALLGSRLKPGAEVILDYLDFDAVLEGADVVFTAEGQLDEQSLYGKAPLVVARRARKRGIPCFMIAGNLPDDQAGINENFSACFSLSPGPVSLDEAISRAAEFLRNTTQQVIRCFVTGMDLKK